MKNDWEPGLAILLRTVQNPQSVALLSSLAVTLERGRYFFVPDEKFHDFKELAELSFRVLKLLKEDEFLILPGGTKDHATLYEIQKERKGSFLIKSYNSGFGTEYSRERIERFNVSCYKVEDLSAMEALLSDLIALRLSLSDDVEKKEGRLFKVIEKIITSHGGKRIPSAETHRTQDRGNCTWKCLSTWFRGKCAGQTVTITEEIAKQTAIEAPYAEATVAKMIGQTIPLNRFFKILGYEKVRSELNEIFRERVDSQKSSEVETRRTYKLSESVASHTKNESSNKKEALSYLSSLVKRIREENALERYVKKDRARCRRKFLDLVMDKLWAFFGPA